ncbi:MAG: TonB-dependent receptor, partial [Verrucomicrobiota bacterium]
RDYHTFFADYRGRLETDGITHNFLIGADRTWVDRDDNETAQNFNFPTNLINPVYIDDPMIGTSPDKNTGREIRDGVYVQDMIEFDDKWRLLFGLRYDDYDTIFRGSGYTTDNLSPRTGLVFLPKPNLSTYLSYSESFEPNGPVSNSNYENLGEVLDPTLGEMLEVGVKWQLLDSRLLVSGALFTIDRKDDPVEERVGEGEDTMIFLRQLGLQRSDGLEIIATGLISNQFTISASLTYLDAEILVDDDPASPGDSSLVDNTPSGAGELSVSISGEYQIDEGIFKGLSLQGGWFFESDRPVDNANTYDLESYNRFDLGLKYAMPLGEKGGVTYRLTASNVFDETYFKGDSRFAIVAERPREVRLSVQYTF